MITRPGAYQNRPCPPPFVRSRADLPETAPVHHRHSLPGTVATFARYRASTLGSRDRRPDRREPRLIQPPNRHPLPHSRRSPAS